MVHSLVFYGFNFSTWATNPLSKMNQFSIILFCIWLIFLGQTAAEWPDDDDSVSIHNFMPKPLLIRSENVTVLRNAGLRLQLGCSGNNPVEWVYSWQDVLYEQLRAAREAVDARASPGSQDDPSLRHHPDSPPPSGLRSSFVSDYHFVPTRNSSVTRVERTTWLASADPNSNGYFKTTLELTYERLSSVEEYICRSVSNHSNNIVLKLDPNITTGEVHVTKYMRIASSQPSNSNEPDECLISFQIARTPSNYFWRCEGAGAALGFGFWGVISYHPCPTSSYCANTYRHFRVDPYSCVSWVTNLTTAAISQDVRWIPMPVPEDGSGGGVGAGVVSCVKNGEPLDGSARVEIAGAVEYFYVRGNRTYQGPTAHVLHTSLAEISMADLIWFDPPISPAAPSVYYTFEYLPVVCFVSKYGFADYRRLLITLNGSLEKPIIDYEIDSNGDAPPNFSESSNDHPGSVAAWSSKEFLLHFREYGPGDYEIDCMAHVWNTTEMVQQTRRLDVKNVLPPSFESEYENVTLDEGETEVRLDCDASGDPEPEFRWNYPSVRGIHYGGSGRGGRILQVNQVSAEWHDGLSITCQAINRDEDSATKVFNLQVKRAARTNEQMDSSPAPISVTTIILLVVGILVIASLATGLVFLYIRFVRFRGAVGHFLTDEEVTEFLEGRGSSKSDPTSGHSGYCDPELPSTTIERQDDHQLLLVDSLPYNSDYDVERGSFTVDFEKELGSGHYGVVYLGHVKDDPETGKGASKPIAIKTVRSNVPIEYFKALLSELKILAHIGAHEHVANLVMAYTAEIKNRVLYVGVELCKCSLLQYLQQNGDTGVRMGQDKTVGHDNNYVQPGGHKIEEIAGHQYQNRPSTIYECDLVRWAAEIATGMEFLTSKRVVHGDLAARNVLLSMCGKLTAKIADFGLARQLVDYSYIKSGRCDLPWKWMALESLVKMAFSTKSDVWAYGVTCWEIFSMGEVPYACTGWTWDFVDALKNGLRLTRPEYASQIMYSKMQECWHENAKDRPNFGELVQFWREQQKGSSRLVVVERVRYFNVAKDEESKV